VQLRGDQNDKILTICGNPTVKGHWIKKERFGDDPERNDLGGISK
jgi:hypothetical protein